LGLWPASPTGDVIDNGPMESAFTRLVGCSVPLQQAPMSSITSPHLVVAVADAGALGMLGMPGARARAVGTALEGIAQRTSGAFGVNFLVPFVDRDAVEAGATRARVVEFFNGDPDASLVKLAHEGGAIVKLASRVPPRGAGCG
jgi:nitronate monooxygenase